MFAKQIEKKEKIYAPDGHPSDMERIMLFSSWMRDISSRQQGDLIAAHMGKPTFPVGSVVPDSAIQYFNEMRASNTAVDYGAPEGELANRQRVADALSCWYAKTDEDESVPITADEVVFTVGGADGISVLLELLEKADPDGKILLQEPWYPLYATRDSTALYPVNVMQESGYRLTAALLDRSITKAQREGVHFRAVLLCDPNNPMGTLIGRDELARIAKLLDERLPNVPVILDQAYCEMGLYSKHVSLVQVASEALRNRIVLLHSATKALSMSGERGAVAVIFDPRLRRQFVDLHVSRCGHAPKSVQYIYAHALNDFCSHPERQQALVEYYGPKVNYVQQRLKQMGADMPDKAYKPEATFYVMADLGDLVGQLMPEEATAVFGSGVKYVLNSEHAAYKLLFECGMTFAPFAYFSEGEKKGRHGSAFMRITCGENLSTLREMMDRLENYLLGIRRLQYELLTARLRYVIGRLDEAGVFDAASRTRLEKFISIMNCPNESIWDEARWMKEVNQTLVKMINSSYAMLCSVNDREKALNTLETMLPEYHRKRMALVDSLAHKLGERQAIIEKTESLIAQLEENAREVNRLRQEMERRGIPVEALSQEDGAKFRFFKSVCDRQVFAQSDSIQEMKADHSGQIRVLA